MNDHGEPKRFERGGGVRNLARALAIIGALTTSSSERGHDTPRLPELQNSQSESLDVRRLVFYGVYPFGYDPRVDLRKPERSATNWIDEKLNTASQIEERVRYGISHGEHWLLSHRSDLQSERQVKNRLDAWALYLGLSQRYNTFRESSYTPTRAIDTRSKYLAINDFWETWRTEGDYYDEETMMNNEMQPTRFKNTAELVGYLVHCIRDLRHGKPWVKFIDMTGVMGRFSLSLGSDEHGDYIAYYDRWKLNGNIIEGDTGLVGTPFEIYDRYYYDPVTFEQRFPGTPAGANESKD